METLVELGHRISHGMAAYPGLPAARVEPLLTHEGSRGRYADGVEFCLTGLELACNTGTYLDSPWHRYADGPDIAELPLDRVTNLPGIVLDGVVGSDSGVRLPRLPATTLAGRALLVRTGWDARWGSDDYWTGPHLADETVTSLVKGRPALVGVDFANIDDTADPARPAHSRLLGAGIVVVEHLTGLHRLPEVGFVLHCAPLAVHGAASMPVRPYAVVSHAH